MGERPVLCVIVLLAAASAASSSTTLSSRSKLGKGSDFESEAGYRRGVVPEEGPKTFETVGVDLLGVGENADARNEGELMFMRLLEGEAILPSGDPKVCCSLVIGDTPTKFL